MGNPGGRFEYGTPKAGTEDTSTRQEGGRQVNPTTLTVIVAGAAFILSIFAASWLNQQAVTRQIDDLGKRFDAKLEAVRADLSGQIGTVRVEVAGLNERVGRIERQLDQIFKPVLPGGER